MEVPAMNAEAPQGAEASPKPKLRLLRFLPKTESKRQRAKERIRKKQEEEEEEYWINEEASSQTIAESGDGSQQPDAMPRKKSSRKRRQKAREAREAEQQFNRKERLMVLDLLVEMRKQGIAVPQNAVWAQEICKAAIVIQRAYRKKLRRRKWEDMRKQLRVVDGEVGTTEYKEDDDPYAVSPYRSDDDALSEPHSEAESEGSWDGDDPEEGSSRIQMSAVVHSIMQTQRAMRRMMSEIEEFPAVESSEPLLDTATPSPEPEPEARRPGARNNASHAAERRKEEQARRASPALGGWEAAAAGAPEAPFPPLARAEAELMSAAPLPELQEQTVIAKEMLASPRFEQQMLASLRFEQQDPQHEPNEHAPDPKVASRSGRRAWRLNLPAGNATSAEGPNELRASVSLEPMPRLRIPWRQEDDALVFPYVKLGKKPRVEIMPDCARNSSWCSDYGSFPAMVCDEDYGLEVAGANFAPLTEQQSAEFFQSFWRTTADGGHPAASSARRVNQAISASIDISSLRRQHPGHRQQAGLVAQLLSERSEPSGLSGAHSTDVRAPPGSIQGTGKTKKKGAASIVGVFQAPAAPQLKMPRTCAMGNAASGRLPWHSKVKHGRADPAAHAGNSAAAAPSLLSGGLSKEHSTDGALAEGGSASHLPSVNSSTASQLRRRKTEQAVSRSGERRDRQGLRSPLRQRPGIPDAKGAPLQHWAAVPAIGRSVEQTAESVADRLLSTSLVPEASDGGNLPSKWAKPALVSGSRKSAAGRCWRVPALSINQAQTDWSPPKPANSRHGSPCRPGVVRRARAAPAYVPAITRASKGTAAPGTVVTTPGRYPRQVSMLPLRASRSQFFADEPLLAGRVAPALPAL